MKGLIAFLKRVPLIEQIAVGLIIGILLAVFVKPVVPFITILGISSSRP